MVAPVIATHDLTRTFRIREGLRFTTLTAVDRLSATVEAGEAVGYIGANGAGKSTTIKMLTGILVPTSGTVLTCGLDPVRDRLKVGHCLTPACVPALSNPGRAGLPDCEIS